MLEVSEIFLHLDVEPVHFPAQCGDGSPHGCAFVSGAGALLCPHFRECGAKEVCLLIGVGDGVRWRRGARTLSMSFTVRPSRFTLPTRSTRRARVARMRLRAVGVGKECSSARKKAWVWNGGAVYGGGARAGTGGPALSCWRRTRMRQPARFIVQRKLHIRIPIRCGVDIYRPAQMRAGIMAYPFPTPSYSPSAQSYLVAPPRSASRHSHHRSHSHSGHHDQVYYPPNVVYSVRPLSTDRLRASPLSRTRAIITRLVIALPIAPHTTSLLSHHTTSLLRTPRTTSLRTLPIISHTTPSPRTLTTLTPTPAPMPLPTNIHASAPPPCPIASASSLAWIVPITMIITTIIISLITSLTTHTLTIIAGVITRFLASEMIPDCIGAIPPAQAHGSLVPLTMGAISMSMAEKSITTDGSSIECSHSGRAHFHI